MQSSDIRICFVGDSLVNGAGDEAALGWTGRLCARANAAGYSITYYNLGIRRDTSRDIADRWHQECARRLPDHCDGRIVLSCGVNDTVVEGQATRVPKAESIDNIRRTIRAMRAWPLGVVGPPPVSDDAHNDRIASLSRAMRAFYRDRRPDMYEPLVADSNYREQLARVDGAHPDSTGYQRIADLVAAAPSWWF